MPRIADTALNHPHPSKPEPKRSPYRADGLDTLPRLPTHCPRCQAELIPCLLSVYMEYVQAVRCVMCGFAVDRQMLQNRLDQERGVLP